MTHEREDHLLDDWLDVGLHELPRERMAHSATGNIIQIICCTVVLQLVGLSREAGNRL